MQNALQRFKLSEGLSYAEIGRMTGYGRATVLRHCKGTLRISAEAAIRYHKQLGVSLADLRPDLFSMESSTIVSQNSSTKGRLA